MNSPENKFDRIYAEGTWSGKSKSIPLSGPGSLVESSLPVIEFINKAIESGEINSVLDLGCGDLTYISTIDHITGGAVSYTGVDISQVILNQNKEKYPWFTGTHMDITESHIFSSDLIVVKDLLFHLTNEQIESLFENLGKSTFKYCLLTTMNNKSNSGRELDTEYNFARVNIRIAPFFRNRFLQTLPRPKSAGESRGDKGEFLVYDMEAFNAPLTAHGSGTSWLMAMWKRFSRK